MNGSRAPARALDRLRLGADHEGFPTMRIAVIAGDGIGRDVTAEVVKVLTRVGARFGRTLALEHLPWGAEHYIATGITVPPDGYDLLRSFDPIFIGALMSVLYHVGIMQRVVQGMSWVMARVMGTSGAESLAVAFLHAYANPAHEERTRALVQQLWPDIYLCTSNDVLAEFREFERFASATVNASLMPVKLFQSNLSKEFWMKNQNLLIAVVRSSVIRAKQRDWNIR